MIRLTLVMLAVVVLSGCAGTYEPVDRETVRSVDDIPPGPGLLTGEEGAFRWQR